MAAGAQMILNFTTPHQPIYKKHPVSMVIIPSESGEYGVSAGHSPIISQLKPGVVTVIHQGVSPPPPPCPRRLPLPYPVAHCHAQGATEKYFIPGGFALTSADSVTVSCPSPLPDPSAPLALTLIPSACRTSLSLRPSL